MKTKFIFSFIFLFASLICFSTPIDSTQALRIANEFFQKKEKKAVRNINQQPLSLVYTRIKSDNITNNSEAYYYIFNKGENNGFVIISGDDRTKSILGYSDTGSFIQDNLPPNFVYWLESYEQQIKNIQNTENSPKRVIDNSPIKSNNFAESITPFLGGIVWNQSSPYNDMCPMQGTYRTVTGCVATAMAQMMQYYQWPSQGKGSNSYRSTMINQTLSVNFSESIYDWENMTETYNSNSTDEEKNAVAKLMYDCGVSVNMQYTYNASGAYSQNVPNAFISYFDYDSNMQLHPRKYYTNAEWFELIKKELNESRPLYISAQSPGGGHAFLCDGYDTNDLFHINWGWGGMSNGYFEFDILDPGTQGIGGGSEGFSMDQAIITGFQKPTERSVPSYILALNNQLSINNSITMDHSFSFQRSTILNEGINDFDGILGIGFYQNNDLKEVLEIDDITIASQRSLRYEWERMEIPSSIENGIYQVYTIYKADYENEWNIIRSDGSINNYLELYISDEGIKFNTPIESMAYLTISSKDEFSISSSYKINQSAEFNLTIENKGHEVYTSIGIALQSTNENDQNYNFIATQGISLEKDEKKSFILTGDLPSEPGEYRVFIFYEQSYYWIQLEGESSQIINIELPAKLTLESNILLNKTSFLEGETLTLKSSINNTGGLYENEIYASIYRTTQFTSLANIPLEVLIDKDETLEIEFDIPLNYNTGNYYIRLSYLNDNEILTLITGTNNRVSFTIENETGINETQQDELSIFPNPTRDFINITSAEKINLIRITTATGTLLNSFIPSEINNTISLPVSELNSGVYLLHIDTDKNRTIKKFIRK